MKKAEIFATSAGEAPGYAWKWRCRASNATSDKSFPLYFDCVVDAREQGYEVELTRAQGLTAPGGAAYSLDLNKRS
jgi:hypothetical protein